MRLTAKQLEIHRQIMGERARLPAPPASVPVQSHQPAVNRAVQAAVSAQALAQQLQLRRDVPCKHRKQLIKQRSFCQGGPVYVCSGGYGECSVSKCKDYHDCGTCPKYERGG